MDEPERNEPRSRRARQAARRMLAPLLDRLDARIETRVERRVREELDGRPAADPAAPSQPRLWVPPIDRLRTPGDTPFMPYSTCSAADFVHPEFERTANMLGAAPHFHRKQWEWVFVAHHLERSGMLAAGMRGLGFGVGTEPLTSAFAAAGCHIVATDAPTELAVASGWTTTPQHAADITHLNDAGLCEPERFAELVTHRFVDMNSIAPDLTSAEFDFCWSSCCFEHLGSLRHGHDFVVESVECLRPGGVAVHTTEFNLSSNTETFESEQLSIYRKRDLDALVDDLRGRGHTVADITIAPDASYLDRYVDVPPYDGDLHLQLEIAGYVSTSVGLVIERGKR